MKAKTGIKFYRTEGDTDPISVLLTYSVDNCNIETVPEDAVVTMNLATSPVRQIIATNYPNGIFLFSTTGIMDLSSNVNFEIEVDDGAQNFTIVKGIIYIDPQIA